MRYAQLSTVRHRVQVGTPLPFNVRDIDRTLLLARGQAVDSAAQMEALFSRGTLVDVAELLTPAEVVRQAPAAALPALWRDSLAQIGDTLRHGAHEGFADVLEASTPTLAALVERDPDLSIVQVLRQDANALVQYGIDHAMHAAVAAMLAALRLGWSDDEIQRLIKVALTMNVSMFELQGQLAIQDTPPTPEQREAVRAHPEFSVRMLVLSGVDDGDWLRAVAQHHERPDGSGYPYGVSTLGELAALVQRADIYTTMISPRQGRPAMACDAASRALFVADPLHPMTAALVKSFGLYPPGCCVRLASGEQAIVARRGPLVTAPVVVALTGADDRPRSEPVRRDTSRAEHSIVAVLPQSSVRVQIPIEDLMALAA